MESVRAARTARRWFWSAVVLGILTLALLRWVMSLGVSDQWTWTVLPLDRMAAPLSRFERRYLYYDAALIGAYTTFAFALHGWLTRRAGEIRDVDEHRFSPVARRVARWATAGLTVVVMAAAADVAENIASWNLSGDPTNEGLATTVRIAAWTKWWNIVFGSMLFVLSAGTAVWRWRLDRLRCRPPVGEPGAPQQPEWKEGRHQAPADFAPTTGRRGICLSGGGIRSASFSLGALQAIQASKLGNVRYVTSVSGGSYMAGAWASLRRSSRIEPAGKIPGTLFRPGSAEERWIRHHTDYLVSSFTVVGGAILALVLGLIMNLVILVALLSTVVKPLGWVIGTAHPELRARTPVIRIEDQPQVRLLSVEPHAQGGGGATASSFTVHLVPASPARLSVAERASQEPSNVTVNLIVGPAIVAEGDGALRVVRQPSVRLQEADLSTLAAAGGDPDVPPLSIVTRPRLHLVGDIGERGSGVDASDAAEVRRALRIEQQPRLRQNTGTAGRLPVEYEGWMYYVVLVLAAAALGTKFVLEPTWNWCLKRRLHGDRTLAEENRIRLQRKGERRHVAAQTLASSGIALTLVLMVLPWVVQEVPKLVDRLPAASSTSAASVGTLGVLLAAGGAIIRYFRRAGSTLGRLRFRGKGRVVDGVIGVAALAAIVLVVATMLNTSVANGPSGRLEGSIGRLLPGEFPDLYRWGMWIVLLGLLWFGPSAHAWSLFSFYRNRLRAAYILKHSNDGVLPARYDETWHWSDADNAIEPEWVVCATVNIRGTGEAAPGRAAGSFSFSRCWVGGQEVGWMPTERYVRHARRWDVDVVSSLAISGAAFSPAMGKQSKDWIGRLFAVANLRLGVWVPNPMILDRREAAAHWPSWRPAWPWYLREVVGWYDRTARLLYLTDGGHWENLGLVELLRRGCTDIWLISAAGDGAESFETLAQAFALAREELGVEFSIELEPLRSPEEEPQAVPRRLLRRGKAIATAPEPFRTGTFSFPQPDGSGRIPGTITIIEATLIGDAPWDVHSYAERNDDFPDISTGYQLMDHRDFEAYRMLGYVQMSRALFAKGHGTSDPTVCPVPETIAVVPDLKGDQGDESLNKVDIGGLSPPIGHQNASHQVFGLRRMGKWLIHRHPGRPRC